MPNKEQRNFHRLDLASTNTRTKILKVVKEYGHKATTEDILFSTGHHEDDKTVMKRILSRHDKNSS